MNTKLVTTCFVIGALMAAPMAAYAADDSDSDRAHPAAFVKDSVVTTKIKAKLAEEKISTLAHIKVDTDRNGMVVLSGKVASSEEADKAMAIAHDTEGVTSVKSMLKIKKSK